jgi:tetratricopeptide (TPR) repeat protein
MTREITKNVLIAGLIFSICVPFTSAFGSVSNEFGLRKRSAARVPSIAENSSRSHHYVADNPPVGAENQAIFAESETERLTAEGLGKFSQADFTGAIDCYSEALKLMPSRGVLYLQRGLARLETGDFNGALADMDKALELDRPNKLAILICRGKAYQGLHDDAKALQDFNDAIKLDSKASLAYIGRAETYLCQGDDDRSLEDLEEALRLDPRQPHAYFLRAQIFKHKKMKEQAMADLHRAVELDKTYLNKDKDLVASKIDSGDNLAEIIKLSGKHATMAAKLIGKGLDLERAGDHLAAIKELTEAILSSPNSLETYKWRAELYMSMSSFELAKTDLTNAIEITPRDPRLFALRAKANLEMGSVEESLKDYTKAIELSTNPPASLYEARGLVYSRHGNSAKAVADFSKSIEIDPSGSGAYFDRGLEYMVEKQYQKAVDDFTVSIKNNNDITVCYKFRGQALSELGDRDGAIADLEKAADLYARDKDLFGSKQVAKLISRVKHSAK